MPATSERQQDRAIALLEARGMARLSEFIAEGITAATVSRMEKKGLIAQLSRGLYQLPDTPLDANHTLAEVAKLIPKGIICLDSALAFHGLTDRIPSRVWVAIAFREWRPRITHPPVHVVRFGPKVFNAGYSEHLIERVPVRIYDPAKTVVDLFFHAHRQHRWYGAKVGLSQAIQGMKEALRQRRTTPAEVARYAEQAGIWKFVQPYLEALTVDA